MIFQLCFLFTILAISSGCDCNYHSGGCTILSPAPAGKACQCSYSGAWTCSGKEVVCQVGNTCPGNCNSVKCCIQGGGDCGGYSGYTPCSCSFHYKSLGVYGCRITTGAVAGAKCRCYMKSEVFTCTADTLPCTTGNGCPAGCTSQSCCVNGGGNCNGY